MQICVNSYSECGHAALEKKKREEEHNETLERSDKEGGMWVLRCEILRMTVLKLNMSDSNTITIK